MNDSNFDPTSDRAQSFRRVAAKRVRNIVEQLGRIGKMAHSPAYDYSESDLEQMFGALGEALKKTRDAYEEPAVPAPFDFGEPPTDSGARPGAGPRSDHFPSDA